VESGQPAFAILIVALTLSLGPLPVISRIKVNNKVADVRTSHWESWNPGQEKLEKIESLLYRVWQGMKDKVEKDGADAKAIKKKKAGEIRAANKAKRSESQRLQHQMLLIDEDEVDPVRSLRLHQIPKNRCR
jgi:hypothetical protein